MTETAGTIQTPFTPQEACGILARFGFHASETAAVLDLEIDTEGMDPEETDYKIQDSVSAFLRKGDFQNGVQERLVVLQRIQKTFVMTDPVELSCNRPELGNRSLAVALVADGQTPEGLKKILQEILDALPASFQRKVMQ